MSEAGRTFSHQFTCAAAAEDTWFKHGSNMVQTQFKPDSSPSHPAPAFFRKVAASWQCPGSEQWPAEGYFCMGAEITPGTGKPAQLPWAELRASGRVACPVAARVTAFPRNIYPTEVNKPKPPLLTENSSAGLQ